MENGLGKQTILVVDDMSENIDVLDGILRDDYNIKVALNGEKALRIALSKSPPDLILLDIMMPDMDGYEVCRRLKENRDTRKIPIIFVTAMGEVENETEGFRLGAVDYITKPVNRHVVQARVKTQLALYDQNRVLEEKVQERTIQLKKALDRISEASLDTIYRLSTAAEYKDEDTGAHVKRMSHYAQAVTSCMGLGENVALRILYAAPMHDVGKIGIPDRIILKPGKLDEEEWKIIKQHTTIGGRILKGAEAGYLKLAEIVALTHHEKWDGSGYPNGLKGKEIPLVGQITAIADVFDALTTKRPYKDPFSLEKAFGIIKEGRGAHFSPEVVDAFFSIKDEILSIKEKYQDPG